MVGNSHWPFPSQPGSSIHEVSWKPVLEKDGNGVEGFVLGEVKVGVPDDIIHGIPAQR